MDFSIARDQLVSLLYLANTIVERKSTMPILANVKLAAEKDRILISATDLEVSLIGEVPAQVKTPGSITVDGKMFYEIARELPSDTVNFALGKSNRIELESGSSRFKVVGTSADEFPNLNGILLSNPIAIDATKLNEMFEKTAYAVSNDETRYNINGVHIESLAEGYSPGKQLIRVVATDGHRMAFIDRPAEGLTIDKPVIVPRKGIQEIRKLLESNDGVAYVGIREGFFTIQSRGVTLGVRLVDGQFPDYRQVIPAEHKTSISVEQSELLAAVRRVALVTSDKTKAVKFKLLNKSLIVSSSSQEYGEASEVVAVHQTGDDVSIGFSARYIIDLLGAFSKNDTVKLHLNGELGPGLFQSEQDEGYSCIVMPMRFE